MMVFAPRASAIIFNFLLSNQKGGYYLIPVNSCPVVLLALIKAKIRFKLIDIEMSTLCIDREKIFEEIQNRDCEGILFIYTYGQHSSFDKFFKTIKEYRPDFIIIEDKCLNIPSFDYSDSSKYADITVYSTGYGKYVDLNYGGFALSSSTFKYNLIETEYNPDSLKNNQDKINTALKNSERLQNIDNNWLDNSALSGNHDQYINNVKTEVSKMEKHKKSINDIYLSKLPDEILLYTEEKPVMNWRFNICVNNKEKILKAIFEEGYFASSQIINLFNDKHANINHAEGICKIITKFL